MAGMRKASTLFLQAVLVLIGLGALAFLLWEPHVEGRNVHATVFQIYFHDPFLAYAYTGAIAFFVALYQVFRLLGYVRRGEVFSQKSVKALRTIKYCGMTLAGFLMGAEAYFFIERHRSDDPAGGVMMGLFLIFVSAVITTAAAVFEKTLQSAVEMKSENDLTV
jgi:hypothetical protein